jgi:hypothetical protein
MNERFTVEEINLMCIYGISSRFKLIQDLIDAMTGYEDDELLELAVRVTDKLSQMSDVDFAELNLLPEYGDNGGEAVD